MPADPADATDATDATDGTDINESRGLSRRTVVLGIGGAATAAVVAVLVGTQLTDDESSGSSAVAVPSDDEAIKRVGDAYRAAYPDDDDVEVLRAALPSFDGLSGQQVQDQLGTLRDQVRADFAAGDIVMVDGWLLAVTEARAAALVSLLG